MCDWPLLICKNDCNTILAPTPDMHGFKSHLLPIIPNATTAADCEHHYVNKIHQLLHAPPLSCLAHCHFLAVLLWFPVYMERSPTAMSKRVKKLITISGKMEMTCNVGTRCKKMDIGCEYKMSSFGIAKVQFFMKGMVKWKNPAQ